MERPKVTSRVTEYLIVASGDNKEVDPCNHHECVAPCDNLVGLHNNTGAETDFFELVVPCDNLGSTYSVRVLFLPVVPRGVVALRNNLLVTPCCGVVDCGAGGSLARLPGWRLAGSGERLLSQPERPPTPVHRCFPMPMRAAEGPVAPAQGLQKDCT